MIGKTLIKTIRSLEQRKYRRQYGLFVAEGDKIVRELLASSLPVEHLIAEEAWLEQLPPTLAARASHTETVDSPALEQISFVKTPNSAIAVAKIPQYALDMDEIAADLSLYLDAVQDPGNMGTILRLADWFGIRHIIVGNGCADPFSPKVVQASMGAILRVKTCSPAPDFWTKLHLCHPALPVMGAFLDGDNVYHTALPARAMIVMGNESQGISADTAQHVTTRLFIPPFAAADTSESLNVAMAAAIICSEFRRDKLSNVSIK